MTQLSDIRMVLVETSHPGNIGAAARAMKTMGLSQLALVAPKYQTHPEAIALASNAPDVLEQARVYPSLQAAVADCTLVMATSARPRHHNWQVVSPRECATELAGLPPGETAALVFGREKFGLTNDELGLCHRLVQIPANPDYSVLNLAAAVQLLAYELRLAMQAPAPQVLLEPGVDNAAMEDFYRHLERVITRTGFLDPDNPRKLMRRLRCLFNRARPDANEYNILRGLLASMEENIENDKG
jgi:tRNA (cytidine32/uridine32-2'-O)-methyltransferase